MGGLDHLTDDELRARAAAVGPLPELRAPADPARFLVLVSRRPTVCDDCDPWEGKLLTETGRPGRRRVRVENQVTGQMQTVLVSGSVAEARKAGLKHPGCEHDLIEYRHGITKRPRRRKAKVNR